VQEEQHHEADHKEIDHPLEGEFTAIKADEGPQQRLAPVGRQHAAAVCRTHCHGIASEA